MTKNGTDRIIALSLELRRSKDECHIQVSTCFRLVDINFLISIILEGSRNILESSPSKKILNRNEYQI